MTRKRIATVQPAEGGGRTYEKVFDSIKQYIVESGLKPGDRLPREVDLCRELHVSRNTMREALKSLQKLGIIEARQKEGMIIREFNYDPILENMEYSLMMNNQKLIDLINLRITLEMAYLEEAVKRATYDQIGRLNRIVERMERKAAAGESLLEEDMAFHLEMYSLVDNSIARDMIQLFWKLLIKIQNQQNVNFDPEPQDTVSFHRQILQQFAAGSLDRCRQALNSHYSVRDRLRMYAMPGHVRPEKGVEAGPPAAPTLEQIMQARETAVQSGLQASIYTYLRQNGQANHRQLVNALAEDPSLNGLTAAQVSRKMSNALQALRRDGFIAAIGEKSGTVWRIGG